MLAKDQGLILIILTNNWITSDQKPITTYCFKNNSDVRFKRKQENRVIFIVTSSDSCLLTFVNNIRRQKKILIF